jgi:hypothetical protein
MLNSTLSAVVVKPFVLNSADRVTHPETVRRYLIPFQTNRQALKELWRALKENQVKECEPLRPSTAYLVLWRRKNLIIEKANKKGCVIYYTIQPQFSNDKDVNVNGGVPYPNLIQIWDAMEYTHRECKPRNVQGRLFTVLP